MIEDLLFLDVHGRVAKKLLDLAELHGVETTEGIRIDMKPDPDRPRRAGRRLAREREQGHRLLPG